MHWIPGHHEVAARSRTCSSSAARPLSAFASHRRDLTWFQQLRRYSRSPDLGNPFPRDAGRRTRARRHELVGDGHLVISGAIVRHKEPTRGDRDAMGQTPTEDR
jgi:hypothetical protein